jgi:argininosuccinate lyase
MKLWQKDNTATTKLTEQFTVGNDRMFDTLLAAHDVRGSLAHTAMLAHTGLITGAEKDDIHRGLLDILEDINNGKFVIEDDAEDVHSQVELLLTRKIGDAGKKIHSGRSRNDQVAVDIKLYLKERIGTIKDASKMLFDLFIEQSNRYREYLLPGYTHMQIAMPSSFGLWFGAYAESLTDDMELLAAAFAVADKNPLGSGAGYGSSFPLNRKMTTELLGFRTMHYNAVNAQMSRGKTERFMATAIAAIAATLSRFSMDVCLFLSQNFNFISFPEDLTTGSSIMPHKKNPDIFELIRGKCNRLQSMPNELALLLTNLPSGYHRELQLTKEILFPGINTLLECITVLHHALSRIEVHTDILSDRKYNYLFTVEALNELVNQGIPFRDAYKVIGNQVNEGQFHYEGFTIERHTHEGSMGNLCNAEINKEMEKVLSKFN